MDVSRQSVALTGIVFFAIAAATAASGIAQTTDASAIDGRGGYRPPAVSTAIVPRPQSTPLAVGEIYAGPGYADVSPHQLVRSAANVLYVAVPSCTQYPTCPGNFIAMQAGATAGNPRSFVEKDAAHRPQVLSHDLIGSDALALDERNEIWVAYITKLHGVHVVPFDTVTNKWGVDQIVYSGPTGNYQIAQGKEGIAIAVSRANVPRTVFSAVGTDGAKHVVISSRLNGAWTHPVQIDDVKLAPGQGALHPTLAYTPGDQMLVAWLVGNETAQYNNPDGTIHVRELIGRFNTTGGPSVEIPDTNFRGNPGYAATTIDQGPSMMVTADGVAEISYLDTDDAIRFWHTNGSNYRSWNGNLQPARQQTHDPSLGPDGHGGIYIYGHGTPQGQKNGHGLNLYRLRLSYGASTWSPWTKIVSDWNVDCSVSTRWSQFFHYFPAQVDFTYWNDHYANLEYVSDY